MAEIGDHKVIREVKPISRADMARIMEDIFFFFTCFILPPRTNFERIGDWLGKSREEVLMVYLLKHMDGIISWVDGNESQREDVTGRITDAITYLCLLWGMVEAKR